MSIQGDGHIMHKTDKLTDWLLWPYFYLWNKNKKENQTFLLLLNMAPCLSLSLSPLCVAGRGLQILARWRGPLATIPYMKSFLSLCGR
jgi:hypothetical protein